VITESVFSMDGDRCDLNQLVALKRQHGAFLLLDEAHSTGVIGSSGRGLTALLGLEQEVDVQMGTLSKALGVVGGFIAGSKDLIDLLTNRARSFIYSTAPPPAIAAAVETAIRILGSDEGKILINKLWANIHSILRQLPDQFSSKSEPSSAIIPLMVGDEKVALDLAEKLLAEGFLIPAIRFPTVARSSARLRLAVSAAQTEEQIERLVHSLAKVKA